MCIHSTPLELKSSWVEEFFDTLILGRRPNIRRIYRKWVKTWLDARRIPKIRRKNRRLSRYYWFRGKNYPDFQSQSWGPPKAKLYTHEDIINHKR